MPKRNDMHTPSLSEQLPWRSAEWHFYPFFAAKGEVKFGVKFRWSFPRVTFFRVWMSESENFRKRKSCQKRYENQKISRKIGTDFREGGEEQQLFNFQTPAVQWRARTSSLNCLSCRNPYQTPHSLNCLPPFHWKPLSFTEKCFVASPSQKLALNFTQISLCWGVARHQPQIIPGQLCTQVA